MNPYLMYWTADEVAECLNPKVTGLYEKLWTFLEIAKNPTPVGGDGSNNTVEDPTARFDLANDDKASYWWPKLTEKEQIAINKAYEDWG